MSKPVLSRADAISSNLTRFYTGKPCARQHLAERYTSTGGCVECQITYKSSARNNVKAQELVGSKPNLSLLSLSTPLHHQALIRKFSEALDFAEHQQRPLPDPDDVFGWVTGKAPPPTVNEIASKSEFPHFGDCRVSDEDVPRWQVKIENHKAAYAVRLTHQPEMLEVITRSNTGSKTAWWRLRYVSMAELLEAKGRISSESNERPRPEPATPSDLVTIIGLYGGDEAMARDALRNQNRDVPKPTGEYAVFFELVSAVGLEAAEEAAVASDEAGIPVPRPNTNRPDKQHEVWG